MRHATTILLGLVASLIAQAASARAPRPSLELNAVEATLDESLEASGLNDVQQDRARNEFFAVAKDAYAAVGPVRSPERRARRLHAYLHREVFRLYRDDADGLPAVLDRGDYNCVSATLLEGMLARTLGLRPWVIPGTRHVFLRLDLGDHTIDVEATSPDGFDVHSDSERARRFLLIYKLATPNEIETRGAKTVLDAYEGFGAPVPLESATAFIWHNVAERTLLRGEGRRAAEILAEGEARHPGLGAPPDAVQTFLARAFRAEFDAHRTYNAYRVASIAAAFDGEDASTQNRLVAAGAELIDEAADRGDIAAAEDIVTDVRRLIGDRALRFERRALPVVVAAAVRVGDWDEAECMADRFAAIELDRIEAGRLHAWVRGRRASRP
jgi:hypothetical protein